ncbi:hypothetical protein NKDENANG_04088 [Candidatus Entotheonellaceae bacterium PAL068K]
MSIRVLDPTAEGAAVTTRSTARLASLEGCTIGLLDNGKIRARELLDYMEEMLQSQYGVTQVRRFKKPDSSRPAPPNVMADIQQCAAVISAVGD